MKQRIHPEYNRINVVCTTCGNEFESGSVKKEIRVDTCSNCHPFYTGRQKFAQADGRIERFNKNTESTLNSFDFETPPFVWCFFMCARHGYYLTG